MNNLPTKKDLLAILVRAIYTAAEVLLGFITVGMSLFDIDWKHALSVAAVAAVYSILKSLVVGVPENKTAGTLIMSDVDDDTVSWNFQVDMPLDELAKADYIRLNVKDNTTKE